MSTFRIALANLRFPATPEKSVTLAEQAIAQASIERAGIICFPECFIPGYRGMGKRRRPPTLRSSNAPGPRLQRLPPQASTRRTANLSRSFVM